MFLPIARTRTRRSTAPAGNCRCSVMDSCSAVHRASSHLPQRMCSYCSSSCKETVCGEGLPLENWGVGFMQEPTGAEPSAASSIELLSDSVSHQEHSRPLQFLTRQPNLGFAACVVTVWRWPLQSVGNKSNEFLRNLEHETHPKDWFLPTSTSTFSSCRNLRC